MKAKILGLACIVGWGLLSGCESKSGKVAAVLATCGTGGLCHGKNQYNNTVLEGVKPSSLVNKTSKRFPSYKLIVPKNLKASLLYQKLLALPEIKNRPGTRMPQGKELSQKKIEMIRKWIEAGATHK